MDLLRIVSVSSDIATAIACAVTAAVIFFALREQRRSAAVRVLGLLGVGILCAGLYLLLNIVGAGRPGYPYIVVVQSVLAVVLAVVSLCAIKWLPLAVKFQDRKYLRSAASELRLSHARFQRAIDGSFSGLWEWITGTDVVWYSPRFRELLGYTSEEEFPNRLDSWKSAVHPDDLPRVLVALDFHLQQLSAFDVEYRLRNKSGDYKWFHARGLAIRDPEGRPYLMAGAIHDIQDRKDAEAALQRYNEYLANKQKMESLGELAGGVAHEFNNLLQAIDGQLQFARRTLPQESPAASDLDVASILIEQSTDLTRQLLDFSRQDRLENVSIDMNMVVNKLTPIIHSMLGSEIELRVRLGKGVGTVQANAKALQQILINLCINARDAMPEGGKLLVRTCTAQIRKTDVDFGVTDSDYYAMVSVSDTGCGMDEEVKARIFEPFFTTKKTGKGTGLGLAIVYSVVKQCGGFVDVESSPGHGSTFSIWLPIAAEPVATLQPMERSSDTPGKHILYVERRRSVRQFVCRALAERGYRVASTSGAPQAIRLLRKYEDKIALAIVDGDCPRPSDTELLHQLRERCPNVPILFYSGRQKPDGRGATGQGGPVVQIGEPLQIDELTRAIDDALRDDAAVNTVRDHAKNEVFA